MGWSYDKFRSTSNDTREWGWNCPYIFPHSMVVAFARVVSPGGGMALLVTLSIRGRCFLGVPSCAGDCRH